MPKLIIAAIAILTLVAVVAPAEANGFRLRQRVVVQRQVVVQKQVQVVQRVRVQQVYAQPIIQAVYAQPIVVQQVQSYSQNICYPQAQIVAPVVNGGGSACFFSR